MGYFWRCDTCFDEFPVDDRWGAYHHHMNCDRCDQDGCASCLWLMDSKERLCDNCSRIEDELDNILTEE